MDKPRRDAFMAVEMGLSLCHHYSLVPRVEHGGWFGVGWGKGELETRGGLAGGKGEVAQEMFFWGKKDAL